MLKPNPVLESDGLSFKGGGGVLKVKSEQLGESPQGDCPG